jgi:hypothetical protein
MCRSRERSRPNLSFLTLPEMLKALKSEPGYDQLPATQRQRLRDKVVELYVAMHPHASLKPA